MAFVPGMKVRYALQPEWGVGHLVRTLDGGAVAEVLFPGRSQPTLVSTRGNTLLPHPFAPGDRVRTGKGRPATITGEEPGGRGLRRYVVRYEDGTNDELPESEVHAPPAETDLLSTLREGRVADAGAFLLRRQALTLDEERRNDALGALLASRVMVKPHQVGVVQRVLSARQPRFILADEVGLGKTIEAGMIFSALRLSGLAARVLVVAPSHLTVQWLAELFHKFQQLFTLVDGDRLTRSRRDEPDVSPWERFSRVVTSLELLSRSPEELRETAAAGWDLVIVDEAHHLRGERAFAAIEALAARTWGLLLLTATPMQLDPDEYRALLTLLDPVSAPDAAAFRARVERQETLSRTVRALLEGNDSEAMSAVGALRARFPDDVELGRLTDREGLLSHLAETYSLSEALVRNRRTRVGGFSPRRLHRHVVEPPETELLARDAVLGAVRSGSIRGAALAGLLRRLDSSPAAFAQAASGVLPSPPALPPRDAKYQALRSLLAAIWDDEPDAKVLLFTESLATLESLRTLLSADRIEALGYHGDLPLVDRDRQVARFRDPDGPKLLLSTEVGGEGRNFQFAHHLVNYDLPWSPATMEQRIGRLDRIGQTQPVDIHVFDVRGTLASDVLSLLADAVGVFGETVGGLDTVLEEVEDRILELALAGAPERTEYRTTLAARVAEARTAIRRAYDPLLDERSFDREAVQALVDRAGTRIGLELDPEDSLEDGLWAIGRDLDERLEETVTDLARRVGIGVDTDEQVEAFQCAFHFGHALKVEALPGLQLGEERTVLGTFWRDTAVEQEEIDFFATGHPIVEALFGFLRDGPYGRNGCRAIQHRGGAARGLEVLFHVVPPDPEDTSPGARVPSRQLSRVLDRSLIRVAATVRPDGAPGIEPRLLELLGREEGKSLQGDQIRAAFPDLAGFVDPAVAEATRAANGQLRTMQAEARKRLDAERDRALIRLERALRHQGLPAAAIRAQLEAERAYHRTLVEALAGLTLQLDSVCAFVLAR
ncbi:MAG TPA: helicase-related protein [Myxococcaceae bacterium]|nr:helicase-related protein [Myxococcaceae bacterium]